jgi:type IV pilus assembly protein PilC
MAKYKYVARDLQGQTVRGSLQAGSIKGAMTGLLDRELEVVDIKQRKNVLQFEITKEKLPLADIMHFSRQLGAFVRAGVPLIESLEVIEEESSNKALKKVLQHVAEEIRTGEAFSRALAPFGSMFPAFYVDMLRAAELTGTLDSVLDEMARYIERDLESRQKIKSALTYPIVVLLAAIATTIVLSVYVLPRFIVFFDSFDAVLPLPTRMLITFTTFLRLRWWALLGGLVGVFALMLLIVRTRRGRRLRDLLLLKVPVIGQIVRYTVIERFCRLLSSMMEAGVPLPEALSVLADGTKNVPFEEGIERVRRATLRGEGLARPMSETKLFPAAVIQMVRVGENTGTLGAQLESSASYFGTELGYKIRRLTDLFEPAVILFMGLVVGFVAIALVSAMYGIYNQIHI